MAHKKFRKDYGKFSKKLRDERESKQRHSTFLLHGR